MTQSEAELFMYIGALQKIFNDITLEYGHTPESVAISCKFNMGDEVIRLHSSDLKKIAKMNS